MLLKVFQPAEIVKAAMRKILSKANRYIDVARIRLPAGRGAEQGDAHHADGAELLFMRLQGAYHLVAVHGFILPHLLGARFDDTAGCGRSQSRQNRTRFMKTYGISRDHSEPSVGVKKALGGASLLNCGWQGWCAAGA